MALGQPQWHVGSPSDVEWDKSRTLKLDTDCRTDIRLPIHIGLEGSTPQRQGRLTAVTLAGRASLASSSVVSKDLNWGRTFSALIPSMGAACQNIARTLHLPFQSGMPDEGGDNGYKGSFEWTCSRARVAPVPAAENIGPRAIR